MVSFVDENLRLDESFESRGRKRARGKRKRTCRGGDGERKGREGRESEVNDFGKKSKRDSTAARAL